MSGLWLPRRLARSRADERINLPDEIQDAVIQWGRDHGRNMRLEWNLPMQCPQITTERMANDPMREREEVQTVLLQVPGTIKHPRSGKEMPGLVAMKITQYGAAGVVKWLDEQNTWGRSKTIDQHVDEVISNNEARRAQQSKDAEEDGRARAWLKRRSWLKIPFLTVGVDLKNSN